MVIFYAESLIAWDISISAHNLEEAIRQLEEYFLEEEMIDPVTWERMPTEQADYLIEDDVRAEVEIQQVDVVFQDKSTLMKIDRDLSAEHVLTIFDHPESLALITDSFGAEYICHKYAAEYFHTVILVKDEVYEDFGIRSAHDLAGLDAETIKNMADECDLRLKKLGVISADSSD